MTTILQYVLFSFDLDRVYPQWIDYYYFLVLHAVVVLRRRRRNFLDCCYYSPRLAAVHSDFLHDSTCAFQKHTVHEKKKKMMKKKLHCSFLLDKQSPLVRVLACETRKKRKQQQHLSLYCGGGGGGG